MKSLILKLGVKESLINFSAPVDLLFAGFKFSYVTPEKIEEDIYRLCLKDDGFRGKTKNNCLEESLLSVMDENIEVIEKQKSLNVNWNEIEYLSLRSTFL